LKIILISMMMRVKKTPPLRKKGEKEYLSLIFFNSSQEKMGKNGDRPHFVRKRTFST